MNYKALIIPYKIMYNHYVEPIMEGLKVGNPMLTYKTKYVNYDIVLSNVFNDPYI